jgi:hypothetical protein
MSPGTEFEKAAIPQKNGENQEVKSEDIWHIVIQDPFSVPVIIISSL